MKILALSLLRIGDVVLSAPALRGMSELYPDAEIHLLVNSQASQIAELLPYIKRVVLFDRDLLQKGLGESSVPVFESYERLTSLVDQLNAEDYDLVINFTHSRLSGWLMSVLRGKRKLGLSFDATGAASFGSSWFKFLNSQVDADGRETFHFSDIFRFSLGLRERPAFPPLVETDGGMTEANTFLESSGLGERAFIAVQPLTSDPKKNWGLEKFATALNQFARRHPSVEIVVLGAPYERERLAPFVDVLLRDGLRAHLAITSFVGAFSLVARAHLLLTCDTSIKHLASSTKTPVVELSLGSSDYHRTGAYRQGSVIIQSREACAPCSHSKNCHRDAQYCASRLPADLVAMVASEVFMKRRFQLRTLAEEYVEWADVLVVENSESGFWAAYSVTESFSEENIGRWIDLTARKIWLQSGADGERTTEYFGSEVLKLTRLLRSIHGNVSEFEWRHLLGEFEAQARSVEGRMNGLKMGIKVLHGAYEDPKKMKMFVLGLIQFREKIRHSPFLRPLKSVLDQIIEDDISPAFTRFRRIVDTVSEIDRRNGLCLKIVRSLSHQIEIEIGREAEHYEP